MFCEKCGYENLDDASNCANCGNILSDTANTLKSQNANSFTQNNNTTPVSIPYSYFDGGLLQQIGWLILGVIVTVITLGICFPCAVCMLYNWEIKHTVIEEKRLRFDGKAIQLFGNWLLWLLLTIITFGIFAFWIPIKIKKWKTKHTFFDNVIKNNSNNRLKSVNRKRLSKHR